MTNTPRVDARIEPEFLGPLGDRPLAETAGAGGPDDLFPGAAAFLNARQQRRRREQWTEARTLAQRILGADEHLLYVAHGIQVPPAMQLIAMGAMAFPYHQVVLLLTDRRLVEVMLDYRGRHAGTRLRTFPWAAVAEMKLGFGKLKLQPANGRRQEWKIPLRGDRKLLDLLLARLRPRLLQEGAGRAEALPLWHCPSCGHALAPNPAACDQCRTSFRSSRLAAILSLAFPGAGLFYSGHPYLAAMDFLGELVLYAVFLLLLLEANPGAVGVAIGLGALFFVMTKLHSIHLSRILVARTMPETPATREGYRKVVLAGGLASLVLIGGAFPLAGAARPVIDRDLDVSGPDTLWVGSRNRADWDEYRDDPTARSAWTHPSGLHVTMFAYPQRLLDSTDDFINGYRRQMSAQGLDVSMDEQVPAPFHGYRFVSRGTTRDGDRLALVHYFVVDGEHHDIHQVAAAVRDEDAAQAERLMDDLLSHARWIDATPPTPAGPPRAD